MTIVVLDAGCQDAAVGLWQDVGLTRPWNDPAADYKRAIDGPSSAVLGRVQDGRLVATVMVGYDGHRGWVYYLAVAQQAQGQGQGRAMMTAAEEWLLQQGVPKRNLMIRSDNLDIQAFYKAAGYTQDQVVVYSRRLTTDHDAPTP